MNEIVKYHNDFSNNIILKNFTANELNFLMAICSKMKNQETNEVIFDFSTLKELIKWDNNNNKLFIESLRNTNKKLLSLNFEMPNEEAEYGGFTQFVLFPTFDVLPKSKQLKVAVNSKFSYLLNGLSSNFTRFELENFTILQSKYSKILYKELMKFKSTGYAIFKIEEFKKKLDIPISYRMTDINKKVFTPAKKEFTKVFQKFDFDKIKKGREITHIEFRFSLKKEKNKEEGIEKEIINAEITELNPIDEIKEFWINSFPGVNFTQKHSRILEKLLKKNSISYIKNYLQEQWDFVKNNKHIENGSAYFSSLILGEKAVLKDYVSQNKQEELSPEEDRKQAVEFMEKVSQFRQTDINEVIRNMEEIKSEEKEKIIEITEEEYEKIYQEYLGGNQDTKIQRRIFQNIVGKQYKIKQKKKYTINDIPEEKLLSKSGKKLVGSALQMRVEKILKEMNK